MSLSLYSWDGMSRRNSDHLLLMTTCLVEILCCCWCGFCALVVQVCRFYAVMIIVIRVPCHHHPITSLHVARWHREILAKAVRTHNNCYMHCARQCISVHLLLLGSIPHSFPISMSPWWSSMSHLFMPISPTFKRKDEEGTFTFTPPSLSPWSGRERTLFISCSLTVFPTLPLPSPTTSTRGVKWAWIRLGRCAIRWKWSQSVFITNLLCSSLGQKPYSIHITFSIVTSQCSMIIYSQIPRLVFASPVRLLLLCLLSPLAWFAAFVFVTAVQVVVEIISKSFFEVTLICAVFLKTQKRP